MKRIYSLLVAGVLALALSGAAGCVKSDPATAAEITCDNWHYFLDVCDGCSAELNCESVYWSYTDPLLLDDLDWCSDCLADEAYYGYCGDCEYDLGYWCDDLMEDYLGSVCF